MTFIFKTLDGLIAKVHDNNITERRAAPEIRRPCRSSAYQVVLEFDPIQTIKIRKYRLIDNIRSGPFCDILTYEEYE